MNHAPILVTGGTGRQGGTGRGAIRELVSLGYRVRAMVRTIDDRADGLRALGAELETTTKRGLTAAGDLACTAAVAYALSYGSDGRLSIPHCTAGC